MAATRRRAQPAAAFVVFEVLLRFSECKDGKFHLLGLRSLILPGESTKCCDFVSIPEANV